MSFKSRAILYWILGAVCIFFAMAAATGARGDAALSAYIVGFLLTLIGGMFWISIMHMNEKK